MKVFVQLGAAVLAALAIVPTPGTEGAAISYGKRVNVPARLSKITSDL